jgi:hypothetical protein
MDKTVGKLAAHTKLQKAKSIEYLEQIVLKTMSK